LDWNPFYLGRTEYGRDSPAFLAFLLLAPGMVTLSMDEKESMFLRIDGLFPFSRKTAKSQISGRARLLPSRKGHNTRLSRSFALPLFAFLNDFAVLLSRFPGGFPVFVVFGTLKRETLESWLRFL
jgi:hypothetical protein